MVDHPTQTGAPASARQENSDDGALDGTPGERVAKALARAGVASRREVERYIEDGRVAINGKVLTTPAVKVGPDDILTVDGMVVASAEPTRLWRYHKPNGLMTTHNDPQGRPTVFEHLPEGLPRVISIGRLDLNSEGLLLLTNDGELSRSLELPATAWVRRYRARAFGHTTQAKLDKLKDGITIDGVAYGPIEAKLDKVAGADRENEKAAANLWITVSLTEGKNREVRRVLEHLGVKVNRLIRLAYGPFALGTLEVGAVEEVGPRVIREQLAAHIAPENLPTGDRRPGPAMASTPGPGRRSSGGGPKPVGGEAPAAKAAPEKEKKEYKPGWAKPKKANAHAVAGAANARAKGKARPPGERQSWGEVSTYKPKERASGAPAARVAVGERPAYGEKPAPRSGGKPAYKGGKPDPAARPAWAKAAPDARAPRDDKPAWTKSAPKSGGKARASTNPEGSRTQRKFEKSGAAPEGAAKGAKPAWSREAPAGARPERPPHPKAGFRSSGKPQGSWADKPRPEGKAERPAFGDKRPAPGGAGPAKRPTGRVYGLPQHGEAHERAPWDAAKAEGSKSGPPKAGGKPARRGPPRPPKR